MIVVRGNELQFIETPGGNSGSGVATSSRGAAEVSVIRQRQQVDGTSPPHTHDREEVMVLLSGKVTVSTSEKSVALGPGDAVIVPPQTPHRVENTGSQPAEWLLVAPAGVRFFRDGGEEACPPWSR